MRLILVRHGETQLNKDGRVLGLGDAPLTRKGEAQARAAALVLAADLPFVLYSSPLARASQTAAIISETLGVPITYLEGLREADVGELAGLTGQEMRQKYPGFMRLWDEDSGAAQMPGGESLLQVQVRAWSAVMELLDRHPHETVVAVGHNFVNLAIVSRVLETPLKHFRRLRQDVGAITRLEITQHHCAVLSLNETAHLRAIEVAQ